MNLNHDYLQLILTLQCTHILVQVTAVVTDEIEVSQSPPEIEAFEGDSINMQCSCKEDQTIENIRVDWTKDSVPVLNATITSAATNPAYINRLSHAMNKTNSKLTIENIIQDDAGLYRCNVFVEIPAPVRRGLGNGTKVTVQAHHNRNYMLGLGALGLLVILIAAILHYKKRQKSQRKARMPVAVDVVRDVIHEENHENEGNQENSSSRDSSQWMASLVYESVDYFAIKGDENEETSCTVSNR